MVPSFVKTSVAVISLTSYNKKYIMTRPTIANELCNGKKVKLFIYLNIFRLVLGFFFFFFFSLFLVWFGLGFSFFLFNNV